MDWLIVLANFSGDAVATATVLILLVLSTAIETEVAV